MSKVTVTAGPCGFATEIEALQKDRNTVSLKIQTQCPHYKPLETELTEVNAYEEALGKMCEGKIYELCRKYSKHASCPVAVAILKAVEVEGKLALATDPTIHIEK